MEAFPFGVGEPRLFRGKRDDLRFGVILRRSFSPEGRSRSSACLFAAGGNWLVRPPPHRPPEPKVPLFYGPCHREHQPPDLRHGERDQAGIEIPPLPSVSSSRAARRVITKKACASRQRVT